MNIPITDLYKLKPLSIWRAFSSESFAFWMACGYLFFEYVRPQAIWSIFSVYPYWARTFLLLAFVGWLFDKQRQFVWSKITTGIFLFQLLIILSSFTAYWPEESWASFNVFFNWVLVFFVLSQTVTTRPRFIIISLIFLVSSFKLSASCARTFAMRGFAFADWGLSGPEGFFQNPGELAVQMVVFMPMALFFIIGIKPYLKRWQIVLLYLMPITAVLTNIGANSRGSQLALAVQLLAMVLMNKYRIRTLLVIILVGYFGLQLIPAEQMARFQDSGDDQTSVQRLLYWKHGWQMIQDHPLLGIGYYNFPRYYQTYHYDDIVLEAAGGRAQLPHNIFIQVGTDTGFTGLTVFIGLMVASCLQMYKLNKEADKKGDIFFAYFSKGMNLALLGYIVAGQFVTVGYYPYLWIHLALTTAMVTCAENENKLCVFPSGVL